MLCKFLICYVNSNSPQSGMLINMYQAFYGSLAQLISINSLLQYQCVVMSIFE